MTLRQKLDELDAILANAVVIADEIATSPDLTHFPRFEVNAQIIRHDVGNARRTAFELRPAIWTTEGIWTTEDGR